MIFCSTLKGTLTMSSYDQHSTVLTDEEFEREYGETEQGAAQEAVPDEEEADSFNSASGGSPPSDGGTDGSVGTQDDEEPRPFPCGLLWGEFRQRKFADAERIVFGLRRGNVGMLIAETNVGKTTLALNLALTLAAGRTFHPFVNRRDGGQRVMFLDGESTRAEIQRDVSRMMDGFSNAERAMVDGNLLVLCDEELEDEPLNLANPKHIDAVMRAAREFKPGLVVVDTMAALFDLSEENSNTEVKSVVMQPLKTLAREANGGVLLAHHIGKPKGEEGGTSSHAYRGRGASNFGCLARSVVLLTADRSDRERVVLSVPKAKGYRLKDVVMRLDQDARWFRVTDETPPDSSTCLNNVVAYVTRQMRTGEIKNGLQPKHSERTVEDALKEAVARRLLTKVRHGLYAPAETTETTLPYSECGTAETCNGEAVC
jgi:AAA domain